ncbi:MAG: autotransporter-associated beta strand repeat-containing protein [Verrucomicrobiota bacterium]|jgi:autotransporter-associated beta strand protein
MNIKKILAGFIAFALLVAAPLVSLATTFFTDNFSNGSSLDGTSIPGGTPTASYTSYDLASPKNATDSTIAANDLSLKLAAATTSGFWEAQALFSTNGIALNSVGDYLDLSVVFTDTGGTLLAGGVKSYLWIGLFNSGGSPPVAGGLANAGLNSTSGSQYATGNCANWQGYAAQVSSNGTSRLYTRPLQNESGTTSQNQDLLGNGASTSTTFNNPGGATLATAPATAIALTSGGQYTLYFRITLSDVSILTISNSLFAGAGTGGTALFSQIATNGSGTNFLTSVFNGLAIAAWNSGTSINPTMDISSILITGQSSAPLPPSLTCEPVPVSVPAGGSCDFAVCATGVGLTYQWGRYGTNLLNAGNISGATSATLIISPASAADVASGNNGYYVVVSGTGGYTTNSTTNSLTLRTAANLVWSGSGNVWDLATTADWLSGATSTVFNFGDTVTFNDTGIANLTVNLAGSFLSAASVTVNTSVRGNDYVFSGSGGFAGPGQLLYIGGGLLTINNANSYSGGTIISNAGAWLVLNNYNGLGTGPVTLALAGGTMEIVPPGSAGLGINGDIIVADDFTIYYDASSSYGAVLLGNLSGPYGKTLTINYNNSGTTSSRVRIYGANTVYNGNLNLTDSRTVWAPYQSSGSQTYNGVISGSGGLIQRGNGATILNATNTYSGGTTPTTGTIAFGIDTAVDGSGNVLSGPIGTGPLYLAPETPDLTGSGTVLAWGGAHTIANPIQYSSATNNLTLIIGGTNQLTFSGPCTLNGNDATGATNRVFQVTNTALTTLSGAIGDGGLVCGLIKTGSGTLALNNTETYTGPTTVSNGTLQVNGQLAAGAVTVATNGILGGTGTILGPVTVQVGGALAPGDAIGTLTINNNLTLAGDLTIEVNKSASPSNDKLVVSGTLNNTGTGTVTVTNLGPALAPGDTFALFNKAVGNGGALSVTGAYVTWTNKLATDGTIAVLSVMATTATNISSFLSGNNLTLSWPANYLGWILQTNSVGVTSTNNWFALPNSQSSTQVVINVNPARTNVFYRLLRPF